MRCPHCRQAWVPRPRPLTARQRELLNYIKGVVRRHAFVPTYEQIGRRLGVKSKATVAKHVAGIRRRGHVVPFGKRPAGGAGGCAHLSA